MMTELFSPLLRQKHHEAVMDLDPSLNVQGYCVGAGGRMVYLVERNAQLMVLKTAERGREQRIIVEAEALEITHDLRATPEIQEVYIQKGRPAALLKDYYPGKTLLERPVALVDSAQEEIYHVVSRLHGRGFHRLDLYPKNLVADRLGEEAGIIDLDSPRKFPPEMSDLFYNIHCHRDLDTLARTLGDDLI
jgi:hypothetical protein